MKRRHLLLGLSLAALAAGQAQAQVTTNITPDGSAGFGTGTTVVTNGTQVQISGGETSGTNVFHSFADFDLGTGDTATWIRNAADANAITNIINRVRSGTPSNIDGTITVADMPNASFWFINPAGVVFGEGASVQVPNAAYFSTAEEIVFGGGQRFSTVTPDGSTFSSAPPQAFGFLGGQGAIGVFGALSTEQSAQQPSSVNFIASDIRVDAPVFGNETEFNFAAVGAAPLDLAISDLNQPVGSGLIEFTPNAQAYVAGARFAADRLLFSGSQVYSNGWGYLILRGNDVRLTDGALIETSTAFGQTGVIQVQAGSLSIDNGGLLRSLTDHSNAIPGGAINISANFLAIENGGNVRALSDGPARAGDITIDTDFFIMGGEEVSSINDAGGDSGNVTVTAQEFLMYGGAVFSEVYGDGQSGSVTFDTGRFEMSSGIMGTATYGALDSGDLTINTGSFVLAGNAFMTTQAIGLGGGRAGALRINADSAQVFGGQATSVGFDGGSAGDVLLDVTGRVDVFGNGRFRSLAIGNGDTGNVALRANEAMLDGARFISETNGTGTAGNVTLELGGQLEMYGGTQVYSRSNGDGNAGNVAVTAGDIVMAQSAFVESSTGGAGSAGAVLVDGGSLSMFDSARIRSLQSAGSEAGTSGDVTVQLVGNLLMTGFTEIQSSTDGAGDAGDVSVSAANISIFDNAYIRANTFGSGTGGQVEVTAGDLLHLRDFGEIESATGGSSAANGGSIIINAPRLLMEGGEINSSTFGSGRGGSILVNVDSADLFNGHILSGGFEAGDAGSVSVNVTNLLNMQDSATIEAFSLGTGNAGAVNVRAGDLTMGLSGINADVIGAGTGGEVNVEVAGSIHMDLGALIQSTTLTSGRAGNVRVTAGNTIEQTSVFAFISASSFGSGNAGSVYVSAPTILMGQDPNVTDRGGQFVSTAYSSGNAGSVIVEADTLLMDGISRIEAPTLGAGDGGSVLVDVGTLRMDGGIISSSTNGTGNAGAVRINADVMDMANGLIISLTTNDGNAGSVEINAGAMTMTGGVIATSSDGITNPLTGQLRLANGDGGTLSINADSLAMSGNARVLADTSGTGMAGDILVNVADTLSLVDSAAIAASTGGAGDAGSVQVSATTINLHDDSVITSGSGGAGSAGDVVVNGESLLMTNRARVSSRTTPDATGAAGRVTVDITGVMQMADNSIIAATTASPGDAGTVLVRAGSLAMTGGNIDSSTTGTGNAGSVIVTVDGDLTMEQAAQIASNTESDGAGGSVSVSANDVLMRDVARLSSSTFGAGNAGSVTLTARNLDIRDNADIVSETAEINGLVATGNAGAVTVDIDETILMSGISLIGASTFTSGDAGNVRVLAGQSITMTEQSIIDSSSQDAHPDLPIINGNSGNVQVVAPVLTMVDGSSITARTESEGNAGNVLVSASDQLFMAGTSTISASTFGQGAGGSVEIDAGSAFLAEDSIVQTQTSGIGSAGNIAIDVTDDLTLVDRAQIAASTTGSGNAGSARIHAGDTVSISGDAQISASTSATGNGGSVTVSADLLSMDRGKILSNTNGEGNAGSVILDVGTLDARNFSRITSSTFGAGNAGNVEIYADEALFDFLTFAQSTAETGSTGMAGSVSVDVAGDLRLEGFSRLDAFTRGEGDAGTVTVEADRIFVVNSVMTSFTAGNAEAGDVFVRANSLDMNGGSIFSNASGPSGSQASIASGTGNAGTVTIDVTGTIDMFNAGISSSTFGMGNAGSVAVDAGDLNMTGSSIIGSTADRLTTGRAGTVLIDVANSVNLFDTAHIDSRSFGEGDAGDITLSATDVSMFNRSEITSASFLSGHGGTVSLDVSGTLSLFNQAEISASTEGSGDAGSVDITANQLAMLGGSISSLATAEGNAGSVFLDTQNAELDGDARISSQTSGSGNAGSVDLDVADLLWLRGSALVTSSTDGIGNTGNAGSITIDASTLRIDDFAQMDSSTREQALGDAGQVDITVDLLEMTGGFIYTSTYGAGNAGRLGIDASEIRLSGDGTINSRAVDGATGNAGNVRVFASDLVSLADDSSISASTDGPGSAGSVSVTTYMLDMFGGSIDSSTSNAGNAGNVVVNVVNANLSGNARVTSNALLGSSGAAGNVLFDASESLEIHDFAGIIAGTRGTGNAGLVDVTTPFLSMDGGAIASSTEDAGNAGDVLITADTALIGGDAKINSGALQGSTGLAGLVDIITNDMLVVSDNAVISASTAGPGDAGAVFITTDQLVMNRGQIASFTRGAGDAGLVIIKAQDGILSDGASINSLADGDNTGDAGGVGITVSGQFVVAEGSTIAASTLGSGNAGKVGVSAGNLVVDNALITSATSGSGDAGDVVVAADDLQVLSGGLIGSQALSFTSGDAGDVTVNVSNVLTMEEFSSISASSEGSGFAGIVEVRASVLNMTGGAINSFTASTGNAGLVGVFVDELNMSAGRIDSASDSGAPDAGNAGSVLIRANSANLSGTAQIDSRGITGNAGDVTLEIGGALSLADLAQVSAATEGSGMAGLVHVEADELVMTGGAINSFTNGSGEAGLVEVNVRQLTMSGGRIDSSSDSDAPDAGDAGGVFIASQNADLSGWAVIESLGVVGDAGDVRMEIAERLTLADDARISAAGEVSGDAGSVFVIADVLEMSGGEINSLTNGSGMAGLVVLDLRELIMTGGRITSASQGPFPTANLSASIDPLAVTVPLAGDAGDVFVRANNALLDGPVSIDSASVNSNAGSVAIDIAGDLQMLNGAQVSTSALGGGDAGAIDIVANQLLLDNFSRISSTAEGEFSAGLITIVAEDMEILNGSEISTNSANGPAGDIVLLLPPDGFLRLAGEEFNGVITTSSGANTGGQIIISDPFLILSEGGSILALGQQGGANVQIQSAFFIRSSDRINLVSVDGSLLIESNVGEQITGTEVADIPFLDASGILSGQCTGVRQGGEVSQFSSRVTGPYAPPDTPEEAEDEMDADPTDRIARIEQGALAPCG